MYAQVMHSLTKGIGLRKHLRLAFFVASECDNTALADFHLLQFGILQGIHLKGVILPICIGLDIVCLRDQVVHDAFRTQLGLCFYIGFLLVIGIQPHSTVTHGEVVQTGIKHGDPVDHASEKVL